MEIKAIRTETDYLAALQVVSVLVDLDPETIKNGNIACQRDCRHL